MSLIITCARHLESETKEEIQRILACEGDANPEISETGMSGIITVNTKLDPIQVIKTLREKIIEEPWFIRYCLRIIPIQATINTNLDEIETQVQKLVTKFKENETYRITVEKRNSEISRNDIISKIAKNIPNKVSLEQPDWIVLIEILGEKTGVGVVKKDDIFSLEMIKRELE